MNRRTARRAAPQASCGRGALSGARRRARGAESRRGVLLLVVLSLLVLFLMIGTAFVITAKQEQRAAKAVNAAARTASDVASQGGLLDEVLMQLVRDTLNPVSVLRYHSLLGDMYGNDGWVGQIPRFDQLEVQPPAPLMPQYYTVRWGAHSDPRQDPTQGQMLEFDVQASPTPFMMDFYGKTPVSTPPMAVSPLDDAYAGQILTFTTGPARGKSTRIVNSWRYPDPSDPTKYLITLRVMAFPLATGEPLPRAVGSSPSAAQIETAAAALYNTLVQSRFVVNGRPFNGTGVGLNAFAAKGAPKLNATEQLAGAAVGPLALLPNTVTFLPVGGAGVNNNFDVLLPTTTAVSAPFAPFYFPPTLNGFFDWTGRGGADESYDAPDFQNMALALIPGATSLQETVWPNSDATLPNNLGSMVLPSFHRPDLLNFFRPQLLDTSGGNPTWNPVLLRKAMMRPSWVDHPNFSGSNPEFDAALAAYQTNESGQDNGSPAKYLAANVLSRMIYGPWDVDNDKDGVRDSVWVDFGAPVMVGPNGKLVKPLAAILCIDLDGRVNVNVHGSLDLAAAADGNWNEISPFGSEPNEMIVADKSAAAVAAGAPAVPIDRESDDLPRGMGVSPADISLAPAVGDNDFRRLLVGDINGWPGRYGYHTSGNPARPGWANYDAMTQVNLFGWADRMDQRSSIGGPFDGHARYTMGVDFFGRPVHEGREIVGATPKWSLRRDLPFELDVTKAGSRGMVTTGADAPFSLAELERALRMHDADSASVSGRLFDLARLQSEPENRLRITTDSYEVPTPSVNLREDFYTLINPDAALRRLPQSIAEVLEMRVRLSALKIPVDGNGNVDVKSDDAVKLFPAPLSNAEADRVRTIMKQLLAPELAMGQPLNVNRPLGNGIDDNGNGVVDEPGEDLVTVATGKRPVWTQIADGAAQPVDPKFTTAAFTPLDADGNGTIDDADALLQRQLLARHLYVVAMLEAAPLDHGAKTNLSDEEKQLAQRIAQWAINAVDFRDADNIMTPFEYDVNPFDGWDVDGWVGDSRQLPGPDGILGTDDDATPALPPFNASPDRTKDYRAVVWGAEAPELLITEIQAWHDRRTEDHADEEVDQSEGDGQQEPGSTLDIETKKDGSYDQLRRPRGALFVELYNPTAPNPAASADTHRLNLATGQDLGIDIAKVAIDPDEPNDPTKGSPVWRLAMYRPGQVGNQQQQQQQQNSPFARPFVDPDDPELPLAQKPLIDRTIYFSGFAPDFGAHDGAALFNQYNPQVHLNPNADPQAPNNPPVRSVRPGRYLVVGSGDDPDGNGVYEAPLGDPSPLDLTPADAYAKQRRVELEPRQNTNGGKAPLRYTKAGVIQPTGNGPNHSGTPSPNNLGVPADLDPINEGPDTRRWMTDVTVIDRGLNNAGAPVNRRLSISEPPAGYPATMQQFGFGARWEESSNPQQDPEGKYVHNETGVALPIDIPLDDNPEVREDLGPGERLTLGSHLGFRQIMLERLANPLLPWNPEPAPGNNPTVNGHNPDRPINPYKVVDSSSVNLTVFNGRNPDEVFDGDVDSPVSNPLDGVEAGAAGSDAANFGSLERGWRYDRKVNSKAPAQPDLLNVWAPEDYGKRPSTKRDSGYFFRPVPNFTFGYLNSSFDFADTSFNPNAAMRVPTAKKQDAAAPGGFVPDPQPFPWFTWNNRPYVSGNELMQVPPWRSSQMLRQFTIRVDQPLATDFGAQKAEPPYSTPVIDKYREQLKPQQGPPAPAKPEPEFAHLENFFYDDNDPPDGVPTGLYRVLDLVHTPSLFAGTQAWLNPQVFGVPPTAVPSPADPRFNRLPPFNVLPEFREPGRINLNTVVGKEVWDGMFHGSAKRGHVKNAGGGVDNSRVHLGPDDDQFAYSRQGYGPLGTPADSDFIPNSWQGPTLLNNAFPTFFANPFRAADAGDLVPLANMIRPRADATMLRSMAGTLGPNSDPDGQPLFATVSEMLWEDSRKNAYFRYQPISRLGSMVTTRSNVYAVWVTIGFFEVEELVEPVNAPDTATGNMLTAIYGNFKVNGVGGPATSLAQARTDPMFSLVYPDGFMLGREDGVDTGEVRRLRGFYIIDRSLPAGFQPGKNLNVENVIRLKRRIE